MKLNALLAVTDQLKPQFKNMVKDYLKFFTKDQGSFIGEKNTYTARDGFTDESNKRNYVRVSTTVREKLEWFIEHSSKFVNASFTQERTNAEGIFAELKVDGISWGMFSSLELLKLKTFIESADLGSIGEMIENIPVRSDKETWALSDNQEYAGREILETPLEKGEALTTIKEPVILEDPNLKKRELPANYTSVVVSRDRTVAKGDYTHQQFSGQWSHRQRAEALARRTKLLVAVQEALKIANDAEVVQSALTSQKIFGYLFGMD